MKIVVLVFMILVIIKLIIIRELLLHIDDESEKKNQTQHTVELLAVCFFSDSIRHSG